MTGGGTVTIKNVGGTIRVRWDTRILALPLMGHASSPFYVIECPAAGATLGAGTVDADGINIGTNDASITGYGSLWYVLPTTSPFTSQPGQFRVVAFQSTTETPAPNWVLICVAFTDAGQQVLRWQAGSVVLPLPDAGQQIQWGSNVQQLGRGANKITLDGVTGNATIPGDLTVNAGPNALTRYGRIFCEDQYHAMILRGDINYSPPNYTVVGGQAVTTFVQFGGTWRFRHVNSGPNVLLFEITPTNVLYKNVALQRIPYVSCRVDGSVITNRGGQITPSSSQNAGVVELTMNPPHPAGANFVPQATLISEHGYVYVDPPASGSSLTVIIANVALAPSTLPFFLTIL